MGRPLQSLFWPAAGVLILDQLSKWIILHTVRPLESIPVLESFFNIVHVRNRGMAFGILNQPDAALWRLIFLVGTSLGAVTILLWWSLRLKPSERLTRTGLSLVLGGAAGNLIDRLIHGEVIDFLDFYIGAYHWPAFNVADSAITAGTILIGISLWLGSRRAAH